MLELSTRGIRIIYRLREVEKIVEVVDKVQDTDENIKAAYRTIEQKAYDLFDYTFNVLINELPTELTPELDGFGQVPLDDDTDDEDDDFETEEGDGL